MIEDIMFCSGSPLETNRGRLRPGVENVDIRRSMRLSSDNPEQFDVAISSSGADSAEAESMKAALIRAGYRVNWYKIPECRVDEKIELETFMETLNHPPCIILLLSERYLSIEDPEGSWYCTVELADALLRLRDGVRTTDQTLVAYKFPPKSPNFDPNALRSENAAIKIEYLLETRASFFDQKYASISTSNKPRYQYLNKLCLKCTDARHGRGFELFSKSRTNRGAFLEIPEDWSNQPDIWKPLIKAVAKATGKPAR